jgi:N-acetylmuramoyl-L-alanine amidase
MHQLTEEALQAFEALTLAMQQETASSKNLIVRSAFRDEKYFEDLIEKNKENEGFVTDTPGASEHHTGLAADVKFWDGTGSYSIGSSGAAKESQWLKQNAHRFGLVVRYAKNKADLTGVAEDLEHYRYVGVAHASYMYENDLCLEEYLEEVMAYGPDNRLVVTDGNGKQWSVYYVSAAASGTTEVILPKGVSYELSGNNKDGFIVAVKSVWEGALTEEGNTVPVSGVTLDKKEISMKKGATVTLSPVISPENASNKTVSYASSDENVVSVSKGGTLTALKAGSATVTVTTLDGSFKASVQVTVREEEASPVIFLDAGHGCTNSKGVPDVGAGDGSPFFTLSGGFYEADLNMMITAEVAKTLKDAGYTVILTRDGYRNEHVTVNERAAEANAAGADLFVSIHANSADSASANGARLYYYEDHPQSDLCLALGKAIADSINGTENCSSTKVNPATAEFAVLTDTAMPSVLV